MTAHHSGAFASGQRFNWRRVRWYIHLVVLLGVIVWRFAPRPWKPARTVETPHYLIASTATPAQTEEVGRVISPLVDARAFPLRESEIPGIGDGPGATGRGT